MMNDRRNKVNLARLLAAADRVAGAARDLDAARTALVREARRKLARRRQGMRYA
jgi:hypothetical protein